MNTARVFCERWQLDCCGNDFAVGEAVQWSVVRADRLTVVETFSRTVFAVDTFYENHWAPSDLIDMTALVERIWAVERPRDAPFGPGGWGPLRAVEHTDKASFDDPKAEYDCDGFIVEVRLTDIR
ncbi:hypothetical protein N1031_10800 [Herbiconiux moechotypicola]|uniref:ASCH domain-containing protein n=1 Tax=Herbiconiux moechotypicola TaxID=637393 RepID=A0ABN3DMH1_9MICO|nr:DUF6578 domain-containing protein [Herbiconiux moechotypicola]MCS5730249.1 hypothetical protein [Herbiconiux moechotypicola]